MHLKKHGCVACHRTYNIYGSTDFVPSSDSISSRPFLSKLALAIFLARFPDLARAAVHADHLELEVMKLLACYHLSSVIV